MFIYLDTSAVLRLVLDEPGRDVVLDLWTEASLIATARITAVESHAGLAAAERQGRLQAEELAAGVHHVRDRLEDVIQVDLDRELAEHAGELAEIHALRGYDAVHLASALTLRNDRNPVIVATWDRALHKAAFDAGLTVAPGLL